MSGPSPSRPYHSPLREAHAAQTRTAIIDAAREILVAEGFAGTTVRRIADRAGVTVDTIYRSIGRKRDVVRAVAEAALSGLSDDAPPEQCPFLRRLRGAETAREKIEICARGIADTQQRLAPVFRGLEQAARSDEAIRSLWDELSERRLQNMRAFVAELRLTGELATGLDDGAVADVIWSMNSTEYWILLVERRGWSADEFCDWLVESWVRLFLGPGAVGRR